MLAACPCPLTWRSKREKDQTGSGSCYRCVDARESVSLCATGIVEGAKRTLDWPIARARGSLEKQEGTTELREWRGHQRN